MATAAGRLGVDAAAALALSAGSRACTPFSGPCTRRLGATPLGAQLVLTHHHGGRYVEENQPIREVVDRICGRRYDTIVAVSEAMRRFLATRYRYPEAKLWTIPNGWSGDPQPRTFRSGHRIVSVANFRVQKGHDVLLSAFARVLRQVPEAELILVGDGPLRGQLEHQARSLGVAPKVRFEGSVREVWPFLADADLFALASRYEPLGIAALEAMAAGLPVVASRVGGLADLVEPGVTGELVPPGDPNALAARLVALIQTPASLKAMGAASRARALAHRADRAIAGYLQLYGQLTKSKLDEPSAARRLASG